MVFVPMHWDDQDSLINHVTIDAFDAGSKQPEFKICAVKLAKA
jgi:nitrate reductase NapA